MNFTDNNIKRINDYQFNLNDEIGKGFSSKVYKGAHITSKEVVAIKTINSKTFKTDVQKQLLNNQIKALRSAHHENIINLHQIYQTTNNIYIITQFCKADLSQLILSKGPYSQNDALNVVKEIAKALAYLNKSKIIHRDVKSSNVLINQKNQIRLADFGFCQFQDQNDSKKFYNVGSPLYMSPEAYKKTMYSHKSDMWALGVVFLQLLKGKSPFQGQAYDQMIKNVMTGQAYSNLNIGGFSKMILSRLLSVDLQRRLTAQQFLKIYQQQFSVQTINHPKSRDNFKNLTMMTPQNQRQINVPQQKSRQKSLVIKKVVLSQPYNQNLHQRINGTSKDVNRHRTSTSPLKMQTNRPVASEISRQHKFNSLITQNLNQDSDLSQSPYIFNKGIQVQFHTPKVKKNQLPQKGSNSNSNQLLKQNVKRKMKLLNKMLLDEEVQQGVNVNYSTQSYNYKQAKQKLCVLLYMSSSHDLIQINSCPFNSLEAMNMKSMLDANKSTILSFKIGNRSDNYFTFVVKSIQQDKHPNSQAENHLKQFLSLVCLVFYSKLFQYKYSFQDLQQNHSGFGQFGKQYKILQKFYIIQGLIRQISLQESDIFKGQQTITYARYVKTLQQVKWLLTKLE